MYMLLEFVTGLNLILITSALLNILTTTTIRTTRVVYLNFDDTVCSQFYYFEYAYFLSIQPTFDDIDYS